MLALPLSDLMFDVEVLRAAKKYRLKEAGADMQQLADGDEFGVGQVLALLMRQLAG